MPRFDFPISPTAKALELIRDCKGPGGALWVAAQGCKEDDERKWYYELVFERIKELGHIADGPVVVTLFCDQLRVRPATP